MNWPTFEEACAALEQPNFNPATNLPMCGAVDSAGNPLGRNLLKEAFGDI